MILPWFARQDGLHQTLQFNQAPSFTCPGNTDNKCTDKQKPGFNWDDLDIGDFFDYKDFNFRGWKCEDDGDKRGRFAPRTGQKAIGGTCSSDKSKSPSFGCGAAVDKFSLGSIHVKPEFDCDLEFHYDMPDGSSCKHRSSCRSSGTTVVNNQCGGAKNVTIVYPPQPNKPKPSCSIKVPTISFDCSTASSTKPPKTTTKKSTTSTAHATTTTSAVHASSTTTPGSQSSQSSSGTPPAKTTTTSVAPGGSTSTGPAQETSTSISTPPVGTSTSISTPPAETTTSSVAPGGSSSTGPAGESGTTSSAGQSSESTSESPATTSSAVTTTITTSYDSTSTIFTTSTQTITSCAPTVTNCPAHSVVTTVVTIAVSTTICPVTETLTTVLSTAPASTAASTVVGGSSAVSSSAKPVETLPCPDVVPSCLNTFLFNVGCADNTDAACYCPDATFVKNVYDCLYAHGPSDAVIAEAVAYFQGICGKWVNQNPAIATDATVTTYITVTAAPTIAPVYTTVIVDVTTVVPCTNDAGEVIPSSSSTVTISTTMTVPQVDFTTAPSGGVGVIPITAPPAATTGTGTGSSPAATTVTKATGTGALRPSSTGVVVVGAGGRVTASFGLAAAAVLAVVAAL